MHEFGLARSIVDQILKLAKEGKWKKVYQVRIEYQDDHCDEETLAALLRMSAKGSLLEKTEFKIKRTGEGETEYTIKDAHVD